MPNEQLGSTSLLHASIMRFHSVVRDQKSNDSLEMLVTDSHYAATNSLQPSSSSHALGPIRTHACIRYSRGVYLQ
jgi:hypothetical protein